MVNLMRRYQQSLMMLITFLVIISFVWFYNNNAKFTDRLGGDRVGNAYGHPVSVAEFQRVARKFDVCQALSLYEFMGDLAAANNATSRGQVEENFAWNSFVLRHEADALGIVPSDAEVIEATQKIPRFQTSGAYDSIKYNEFVQQVLAPHGFSPDELEEIVADSLRLEKIKKLLGATDSPAPAEVRTMYERGNRKTESSVIRLKLDDFKKDVKISDEDVQKRFDEKKDVLQHAEKRKVKFVAFTVEKTQQPLVGKERVIAMQKLADQASEFAQAMTAKDAKFDDVAAAAKVPVAESPEFEAGAAPKELGEADAAAQATFKLTNEEPLSDVVTTENGYYVLQLAGISPKKPMSFDEAKQQLTDEMTGERANEALNLKATEFRTKISEALKAGKSFADAAKEAGATPEPFPPFSPVEPKMDQPDAREVMVRAAEMNEGELSDFTPTKTGGLLIFIDKRQPVDEAAFETKKTEIAGNISRMKKEAAFQQWLKERRGAAGFTEAKG